MARSGRLKGFALNLLVLAGLVVAFFIAVGILTMVRHASCGRLNAERISHLEPGHDHPGPGSIYVIGVGPGPPPSQLQAYYEAEAAMENAGCGGTGDPGPGD